MPENENITQEPDHVYTMEINGTTYTVKTFFNGKDTINDIIARRIAHDMTPPFPNAEKG